MNARIDFLGLQAFLAIAERGSFQRAAAQLNLSQTALSHRMKKLEQDLGLKLFIRTTRQVTLTEAGAQLLPNAQRIIAELAASFEDIRHKGRERQERIAICCLPTLAVHYLPRLLRDFHASHPSVSVRLYDNSATEICELVRTGTAEFGLSLASDTHPDLEVKPLMKEPFVLLCPKNHPIAAGGEVNWSQLEGIPLVRTSRQAGNRLLIDDALGPRRDQLDWRWEVLHIATAVAMVTAGVGLTIIPRLAIDGVDMSELVALPLHNPGITRTIGLVSARGRPLSPAAEDLRRTMELLVRADGLARMKPVVSRLRSA
ncbi:MAG: LysR family transcriptional regulator [Hyphomicrobiales bacterium]|nr:LysR family transcriptional regulator [Hyphomicrobiales bacterium]